MGEKPTVTTSCQLCPLMQTTMHVPVVAHADIAGGKETQSAPDSLQLMEGASALHDVPIDHSTPLQAAAGHRFSQPLGRAGHWGRMCQTPAFWVFSNRSPLR